MWSRTVCSTPSRSSAPAPSPASPTYLADRMLVEPIALAAEADELERKGVRDPLSLVTVHPDALLTTPVHVAANRTREDLRGAARHGSCGLGIGETTWYDLAWQAACPARYVVQNLLSPGAAGEPPLRVRDCLDPAVLRRKLDALQRFYQPLLRLGAAWCAVGRRHGVGVPGIRRRGSDRR